MHRYFGDLLLDNANGDVFNDVQRVQASTATWILLTLCEELFLIQFVGTYR